MKSGRDSVRGNIVCLAVKCWLRILHMDSDELVVVNGS
jgi:hypothetical protein